LNRIPLGGFCSLEGEDPSHPETFRAKDSFITAKLWKKLLIILGGIIMNLIAARIIFTALFWIGINPLAPNDRFESESYLMPNISFLIDKGFADGEIRSGVVIREIAPDSLAESFPLQVEDTILSLNETDVEYGNLSTLLSDRGNQHNTILIERN
jgi:membrane-associated protease RseP (regulator of RpoE activity)